MYNLRSLILCEENRKNVSIILLSFLDSLRELQVDFHTSAPAISSSEQEILPHLIVIIMDRNLSGVIHMISAVYTRIYV